MMVSSIKIKAINGFIWNIFTKCCTCYLGFGTINQYLPDHYIEDEDVKERRKVDENKRRKGKSTRIGDMTTADKGMTEASPGKSPPPFLSPSSRLLNTLMDVEVTFQEIVCLDISSRTSSLCSMFKRNEDGGKPTDLISKNSLSIVIT